MVAKKKTKWKKNIHVRTVRCLQYTHKNSHAIAIIKKRIVFIHLNNENTNYILEDHKKFSLARNGILRTKFKKYELAEKCLDNIDKLQSK